MVSQIGLDKVGRNKLTTWIQSKLRLKIKFPTHQSNETNLVELVGRMHTPNPNNNS